MKQEKLPMDDITCRIWVGGLPVEVPEKLLEEKFEKFGNIKWVRVRTSSRDTFAFIQYHNSEDAWKAVDGMDQAPDFGSGKGGVMKVSMAKPSESENKAARAQGRRSASQRQRYRSRSRSDKGRRSSSSDRGDKDRRSRTRSRRSYSSRGRGKIDRSRSRSNGVKRKGKGKRSRSRSRLSRAKGKGKRSRSRSPIRKGKGYQNRWRSPRRMCSRSRSGGKGKGDFNKGCDRRGASRSPPPRRLGSPAAPQVRVENLPEDIGEDELFSIGSDFGKVVQARTWVYRKCRMGTLLYDHVDEAMKAMCELHGRRVDGWDLALKAQIPCPCCGHQLW